MKVVHVIGQLVPGGSEKVTLQVAAGMRARGHDHRVAVVGEIDQDWVAAVGGADVPVVATGAARLVATLRAQRPHVVQGHAWRSSIAAGVLGRAVGAATVATLHRVYYPAAERGLDRLLQRVWDQVLVDSDAVRSLLVAQVALRRERITVVPNFVADACFAIAPPPPDPPVRLLMAAHFTPVKGHATLLHALARIDDDVHLDLLGEGPLTEPMRALAAGLGIADRVRFHGRRGDLLRWLAEAHVVVLPSAWEGFGLILAEGMAAGRPVVACAAGGACEVVADGETGYLTPVGDVEALAAALARLAADPQLRARLGEQGRRRARARYARGPVLDAYEALYADVTASPR